ncbi:MAG TPA: hypothetical protein VHM70_02015 [Polyangiaceae bacterium]|jgi:hypothetical protein|nr:hypothetical protein [Polyangiaceae bacterium]
MRSLIHSASTLVASKFTSSLHCALRLGITLGVATALVACASDKSDGGDDTKPSPESKPTPSPAASPSTSPSTGGDACGEDGQACCASDMCNSWRSLCVDGKCEPCGQDVGQKCCVAEDKLPCSSTPGDHKVLGCGNGKTCELCGDPGQPCCLDQNNAGPEDDEYDVCGNSTAYVCLYADHTCVDCGALGKPCCEYGACTEGTCDGYEHSVNNGTCK